MSLSWVDWTILVVVIVSTLFSLKRGLFKEVISLLVWIVAVIVSLLFYQELAKILLPYIESASLRVLTARFLLFALCIIMGSVFMGLMGHLIKVSGLSSLDRILGMIFGALRGVVIVIICLMLGKSFLPLQQEVWWQQSVLIPHFSRMEVWFSTMIIELKEWLLPLIVKT